MRIKRQRILRKGVQKGGGKKKSKKERLADQSHRGHYERRTLTGRGRAREKKVITVNFQTEGGETQKKSGKTHEKVDIVTLKGRCGDLKEERKKRKE